MRRGTNHFRETEDVPPLSEQQAREQLQYEMRGQKGRITFETKRPLKYDDHPNSDGFVVAKINGEQVDHYLFSEEDDGN